MTSAYSADLSKQIILALVAALLLALPACGKNESPQVAGAKSQAAREQGGLEHRMATMAIELLRAHVDYIFELGADKSLTSGNLAEKLAASMNSASTPGAGDSVSLGPKFTYVANQGTGPWQVVLKVEGQVLRVTAYGSDTAVPLEQRDFEIGRQ